MRRTGEERENVKREKRRRLLFAALAFACTALAAVQTWREWSGGTRGWGLAALLAVCWMVNGTCWLVSWFRYDKTHQNESN